VLPHAEEAANAMPSAQGLSLFSTGMNLTAVTHCKTSTYSYPAFLAVRTTGLSDGPVKPGFGIINRRLFIFHNA